MKKKETKGVLPDLEKARDEKCFPVARAIMGDMAELLIPEDANKKIDFNPIILKMIGRMLEADTNVVMENSYVIQLILGVLSGLNATIQSCVTVPIDDIRYGAISKKILVMLSEANIKLGSLTPEEIKNEFAPLKDKINALFAEEKLSMHDVKYVMDNIFTTFNTVTAVFNKSVEASTKKAEEKALGLDSINDLTMKKLDSFLKSDFKA